MEPVYMNENRYSYLVGSWSPSMTADYEVEKPETEFEKQVQRMFMEGQAHLRHEEYMLALSSFQELMALILHMANPEMPVNPNLILNLAFPMDVALVNVLSLKAAEILKKTPLTEYSFPASFTSQPGIMPQQVKNQLKPVLESGLRVTSYHGTISEGLKGALAAVEEEEYELAIRKYSTTLRNVPVEDTVLRASLLHDLSVLWDKVNNHDRAIDAGNQSVALFSNTAETRAHVEAMETVTGILRRGGRAQEAEDLAKKAKAIRESTNLNPILATISRPIGRMEIERPAEPSVRPIAPRVTRRYPAVTRAAVAPITMAPTAVIESTTEVPLLMGTKYVSPTAATKSLQIQGETMTATINLDANATANVNSFLQIIRDTNDLQLVVDFWVTPVQMIAYMPHMYFFIIPMAIGDCFKGMGNRRQAEQQYLSVLPYPYINKKYEMVKLWTRLAQVYLEMGDQAYRWAKDNVSAYGTARAAYENIALLNKTLKPNSPLYKDSKFSSIKTRVTNFLAAADPMTVNENPAITTRVLEALSKLQQIEYGLNYFGFAPDYFPPFSFEYLQNTARYFTQQASHIEQRYIQYKSQAENEQLQREQLDQQAEVARQSVILEQRGVAEAEAGIASTQASLNYADVQYRNAVKSKQDFERARWELLEYAELEGWANAASVSDDDEMRLTISGYTYYSSDRRMRSDVLADLAYKRTRLSHELESKKLQRAIDSAAAYTQVAQAQLEQAKRRKAIAEQRVQIAKLQQRHAEENRDFLDMREFSSRLWYELAMLARQLKQRYLDMATEIAFLMERAYNAETERNLHVIRYDYSQTSAGGLMGADLLLEDIDYFTYDYVTTTKTKKIPVKQVISLADSYAMAFQQLKVTGSCYFQTELTDFDRQHPGMYLCKLRNVEVVFVGLTSAASLAGSLRNIGISRFRRQDGSIVTRNYPSDTMALSQYEIRQDALVFRFNPNDLRLFENNGIDTLWQLELPLDANEFNFGSILDIQLVLYYDGFFSSSLETTIKNSLPTASSASRGFSMRMFFFDELFYLKNKGEAELVFEENMFPFNQKNLQRAQVTLKALGEQAVVDGLTMRLTSANHGGEIVLTTDSQGEVNQGTPGQPLNVLLNAPMLDEWKLRITAADNQGLVENGVLNLSGLDDILIFFEYAFEYR